MKLFFPPQGITSSASRPEILKKIFLVFFDRGKLWILLLQYPAFKNGHTLENIDLMINNFINVSKLHIIRQKKDCAFR